jgi:DNA-directed RNA polymerase subunit RPC12/RpoP
MFIYEYRCHKCEKDYLYRIDIPYNGETLQCPNCGGEDYKISEYKPFSGESIVGKMGSSIRFG